jgi:cytochrome c553
MNTTLLFATAILFPTAALAQNVPGQAQACATCHGDNGQGDLSSGYPRIAGQPAAYLERQLDAFANGQRSNPVMAPIAKLLSETQRKSLARYYSQIVLNPPDTIRASTPSPRGRHLATVGDHANRVQSCQACHGPGGIGQNNVNPLLAGQPPQYLVSALHEWKSGTRKTDPTQQMNHIASGLSDSDIQALADYFGDQPAPATAVREVNKRVARAAPTGPEATATGTTGNPSNDVSANGAAAPPAGMQEPGGAANGESASGSHAGEAK